MTMRDLPWTALITLLALGLYFWTSARVGWARYKTGVKAPAVTGDPLFERTYRVQANTLEWLPLFLPSLWLCGFYVGDRFAALCGLVWVVGRLVYAQSYVADPAKRGTGFVVQAIAAMALMLASVVGVVRALLAV